jgi:hypothetical protein
MSSRVAELIELQMHLEYARRLLEELTREAVVEREKLKEEEEEKKKEEEKENKRGILPHPKLRPVCQVKPEVRTPPVAAAAVAAAPAAAAAPPQLPVPVIHPRLWHRRQRPQEVFTLPETEDWESEATQPPSALPTRRINWENDWSRRCVCGARPGRCHH